MRLLLALCGVVLFASAAPAADAQDTSLEPTYGDLYIEQDFVGADGMALVAGGSIDVNVGGCAYGYVADAPDVNLYYTTDGTSLLNIAAVSADGDTTLLVNLPDGRWTCDDDSYGDGDPIVRIPSAGAGLYNIWVGTYGNELVPATLFISEIGLHDLD